MAEIEKKETNISLPDTFKTLSDEKLIESLGKLSMNQVYVKYLIGCHLLVMKNRGNWSNPETLRKYSKTNCYYPNLDAFCYNEFGITSRSGYLYRNFAQRVNELKIQQDLLKQVLELGFVRASKILDASATHDDIHYFMSKAVNSWNERDFLLEMQVAKQRRLRTLAPNFDKNVLPEDSETVQQEVDSSDDLHPVDAPKPIILQKPVSLKVQFTFEDQLIHYQKAAQILEQMEKKSLSNEQVVAKLSAFYLAHSVHDPTIASQVLTTEQLLSAVEKVTGLKLAVIQDENG